MLDNLEGFQLIWKVSEQSGNFQPGNFLYNLEVYNQSGKFLDSLERQRYVNTWTKSLKSATNKVCKKCNILVAITIYAFLAFMSRKRFTRFVRKVFAHKSVPTGKLRLFRPLAWRGEGYVDWHKVFAVLLECVASEAPIK